MSDEEGYLFPDDIPSLDIRFSNRCNLRCRTCGPANSSRWGGELSGHATGHLMRATDDPTKLLREIARMLPKIEEFWFAGGEPLLMEEHYQIVQLLLDAGRTDTTLIYNTNFTEALVNWDTLFEMWDSFPRLMVCASLDGSYRRGEYLRKGLVWEKVVCLRRRMKEIIPRSKFLLSSTLSLMNCLHLPDFHIEWAREGLINPSDVIINILQQPEYFRLSTLSKALKEKVRSRYRRHIDDYLYSTKQCRHVIQAWESSMRFMDQSDTSYLLPAFHAEIGRTDSRRHERFEDTFPELRDLAEVQ